MIGKTFFVHENIVHNLQELTLNNNSPRFDFISITIADIENHFRSSTEKESMIKTDLQQAWESDRSRFNACLKSVSQKTKLLMEQIAEQLELSLQNELNVSHELIYRLFTQKLLDSWITAIEYNRHPWSVEHRGKV